MSIIPKTVDNKSNLTINSLNIDSFTTTIFNNKLASKIVYSDISSNITIDNNVYVKLTTNATSIGYGAGGGVFSKC